MNNDRTSREIDSKKKWKEIRNKKKSGIKNPYDHFIHNLPNNLQNITNKNSK